MSDSFTWEASLYSRLGVYCSIDHISALYRIIQNAGPNHRASQQLHLLHTEILEAFDVSEYGQKMEHLVDLALVASGHFVE